MTLVLEEDPDFKKILAFLLKMKGFDARQYKRNYIKRRLAVRMRAVNAGTYLEYLRILQTQRQEPSFLLDRLTIHVTEFFRDPDIYHALREKIFPGLEEKARTGLRIWSAGCSTGEEPYSIAILLKEWMEGRPGDSIEILATDIDSASVRTAEQGEYPLTSVQKVSRDRVHKWFQADGTKVRVEKSLRASVRFRVHDLLGGWFSGMAGLDMIFCRNMLIYLTSSQQQRLYEQFAGALVPGGYLVLGLTETLLGPARKFFRCVDIRHRIYKVLDQDSLESGKTMDKGTERG